MGLAYFGLERIYDYADQRFLVPRSSVQDGFSMPLDHFIPGLSSAIGMVLAAFALIGLVAIIAGSLARYLPSPAWQTAILVAWVTCGAISSAISIGDFVRTWLSSAAIVGLVVLGVRRFFRFNCLACAMTFTTVSLVPKLQYYWRQPLAELRWEGSIALVTAAVLVALAVWIVHRGAASPREI